ncbi:MAG: hypothetical protein HGA45_09790 [Chloroflexales bacterium]|nr:hypothetical protein [Chloroflexales bacterium]
MDFLYQIDSLEDPADYPDARRQAHDPYVELSWYCVGRTTPIAPYQTLIVGYDDLAEPVKTDAARYMDEWFTKEEVTQLLPYLCIELGHIASVRRLPVPMNIFLDSGESIANPVARLLNASSWRVALTLSPADNDYPLPFSVSAYYSVVPSEHGEAEPLG